MFEMMLDTEPVEAVAGMQVAIEMTSINISKTPARYLRGFDH